MEYPNNKNQDARGKQQMALLIIDMVNDLEFDEGEALYQYALPAANKIVPLKMCFQQNKMPVIYANDNFGKWQSNFKRQVEYCMGSEVRGREIANLLQPNENDYFVLKPKHSAFYLTPLDLLLAHLKVNHLVVTGVATDICVFFTCMDAYMRDYPITIPSDCVAANTQCRSADALVLMRTTLKANVRSSVEIMSAICESTSSCS